MMHNFGKKDEGNLSCTGFKAGVQLKSGYPEGKEHFHPKPRKEIQSF